MALGYEDLNDHEQLREDPLLMLLSGSAEPDNRLAGKSTLNRLELGGQLEAEDRYKKVHYDAAAIDELLVNLFLEAHAEGAQFWRKASKRLSKQRPKSRARTSRSDMSTGNSTNTRKLRRLSKRNWRTTPATRRQAPIWATSMSAIKNLTKRCRWCRKL